MFNEMIDRLETHYSIEAFSYLYFNLHHIINIFAQEFFSSTE